MKLSRFLRDADFSLRLPAPPFWMWSSVLVLAAVPLVFGAVILRERTTKSANPRIHLWQDMDNQPKLKAQSASPTAEGAGDLFADGMAMRRPVSGTVARGRLRNDDHLYRGFTVDGETGQPVVVQTSDGPANDWIAGYPEQVEVDDRFLQRGKWAYNAYCYSCHGVAGLGNGPVHQAATLLVEREGSGGDKSGTVWVQPTNITLPNYYASIYPNGHLFNTISHGKGNMKGLGDRIAPEDRWAIIAHVRAMQLTQDFEQVLTPEDVQLVSADTAAPAPTPAPTPTPDTPRALASTEP
ncbi:MAG: cytochrome c [Planctomycetota bacterium]